MSDTVFRIVMASAALALGLVLGSATLELIRTAFDLPFHSRIGSVRDLMLGSAMFPLWVLMVAVFYTVFKRAK